MDGVRNKFFEYTLIFFMRIFLYILKSKKLKYVKFYFKRIRVSGSLLNSFLHAVIIFYNMQSLSQLMIEFYT